MMLRSLSSNSRKCVPLASNAWKVICQVLMMSSLSAFLLKSHDSLVGNNGVGLKHFVSLSTSIWWGHFASLGQSQNSIVFSWFLLKNVLRSFATAMECTWNGCTDESNVHCAEWMASVMTTMWDVFGMRMAWLILHLMANNSASVVVTLTVWWTVFLTCSEWEWTWEIDVATLSFRLASDMTMTVLESIIRLSKRLSSWRKWESLLSLFLRFAWWNEKRPGNLSLSQNPGEISLLRVSKAGKRPLRWEFTSVIELLIFCLYLAVMFSNERWCDKDKSECWFSKRVLIATWEGWDSQLRSTTWFLKV